MKNGRRIYIICWAALVVLFNAACFLTPSELAGYSKYGGAFWASYVCIMLAFIGHLVCAQIAFRTENAEKLFLRIPLIRISYTGLILTLIFGTVCMVIPGLPNWAGAMICLVIIGLTALSVLKAHAAAELVIDVSEKVRRETEFIKILTAKAGSLCSEAKSDEAKTACKRVYEAIRYSDPVSVEALERVERSIREEYDSFDAAVRANDRSVSTLADELLALLSERNRQCKALK